MNNEKYEAAQHVSDSWQSKFICGLVNINRRGVLS